MNRASMVSDVLRRLDEDPSAPVYWSEADVIEALNEGLVELADATEYHSAGPTLMPYTAGTMYYDLQSTLGLGALYITEAYHEQSRTYLTQTSAYQLDRAGYPRWQAVRGTPAFYLVRGLSIVGLYPTPAADGTLRVVYRALPPLLEQDADAPTFPETFHPALVEYALYSLLAEDGEFDEALYHYAEYKKLEAGLADWVRSRLISARSEVVGV